MRGTAIRSAAALAGVALLSNLSLAQQPAPAERPSADPAAQTRAVLGDCARPRYPERELRDGREGKVTMAFLIGTEGQVLESKIVKSSGSRQLDQAARSALAQCRYQPGKADGKPAEAWTMLQYVWQLDGPARQP